MVLLEWLYFVCALLSLAGNVVIAGGVKGSLVVLIKVG
jgi:hypothetical protein